MICLPAHEGFPDAGPCDCWGYAHNGPDGCICWEPEYDLEQATPDETAHSRARDKMCSDCAYRPDSPERANDDDVMCSAADLERTVTSGVPFYCHDGMRRRLRWRHPNGAVVEAEQDHDYAPPILKIDDQAVPFRADGAPALLCAGWLAHRLTFLQHGEGS